MLTSYRRATVIASRIGVVCAAAMGILAFSVGAWIPVFIAVFIAYVGLAEARQVEVMESVKGLRVRDVMIRQPPAVPLDTPLWEVARLWQGLPISGLPVVSAIDSSVGMLWLKDIARSIDRRADLMTPAGQLADHGAMTVSADDELESVMLEAPGDQRLFAVVDRGGRLMGLLDFDSVLSRGKLSRIVSAETVEEPRLDVVS